MIFDFFFQALLMAIENESMIFSSDLMSDKLEVLIVEMFLIISLMNDFSSVLSLAIEYFPL